MLGRVPFNAMRRFLFFFGVLAVCFLVYQGYRTDPPSKDTSGVHSGVADWWMQNGGLLGVTTSLIRTVTDPIRRFLFGAAPGQNRRIARPDLQPAGSETHDQAPDFQRVENATVSIDYGANGPGMPEGGATGFIVTYKGRLYVVTNIHVLAGFAQEEAQLTWYEGPSEAQLKPYAYISKIISDGGRDARFARRTIAFHVFAIPGRREDPSYLRFMALTELPKFKSRDGQPLKVAGQMLVSRLRDVVLIPVETEIPPLEFSRKPPKEQENVVIASNPEAKGTLYLVRGSIRGLGPDRLELRVEGTGLVPGMSGSPVVSAQSGAVLGVVSYRYLRDEFDPEKALKQRTEGVWAKGGSSQVRDFAYRLDNLSDLESFSWARFCWEMGILHSLEERTRNVLFATDLPIRNLPYRNARNSVSTQPGRSSDRITLVPHSIMPDFNSSVAQVYGSMVASLHTVSSTSSLVSKYGSLDAYRKRLIHALDADMLELTNMLKLSPKDGPPIKIPYLQRVKVDTVERDQQGVSEYIRFKLGSLPSGVNR